MAPWYEEAEFYHIYPIGLTGAPRKMNRKKPYTAFPHWNSGFRTSQISVVPQSISALFESTTHGYDTKDYKQVDRRLGDNADFAAYVKKPTNSASKSS